MKKLLFALGLLSLTTLTACDREAFNHPDFEKLIAETAVKVEMKPGLCAGSVVSETEVLTANHCVTGKSLTDYVEVTLDNKTYLARVERTNPDFDLALLVVPGIKFKNHLELAQSEAKLGDTVWMIGHPRAIFYNFITKGIVGNLDYVLEGVKGKWTVLDITATFGNSGGMIINNDGELIGVASKVVLFSSNEFGDNGEIAGQYSLIVRWEDIKEFLNHA